TVSVQCRITAKHTSSRAGNALPARALPHARRSPAPRPTRRPRRWVRGHSYGNRPNQGTGDPPPSTASLVSLASHVCAATPVEITCSADPFATTEHVATPSLPVPATGATTSIAVSTPPARRQEPLRCHTAPRCFPVP